MLFFFLKRKLHMRCAFFFLSKKTARVAPCLHFNKNRKCLTICTYNQQHAKNVSAPCLRIKHCHLYRRPFWNSLYYTLVIPVFQEQQCGLLLSPISRTIQGVPNLTLVLPKCYQVKQTQHKENKKFAMREFSRAFSGTQEIFESIFMVTSSYLFEHLNKVYNINQLWETLTSHKPIEEEGRAGQLAPKRGKNCRIFRGFFCL